MTEKEQEQPPVQLEAPEVTLKKLGQQDAQAGLPSRQDEIEEHFKQAYADGYEAEKQDMQDKLDFAALCGHQLYSPK